MKIFVVLAAVLVAVSAANDACYKDAHDACTTGGNLEDCNAKYSGVHSVMVDLQSLVNAYISHSYDYLLTSTYFGNYEKHRVGFQKVFKALSDKAWKNSIELIQYITKRGGHMDFNQHVRDMPLGTGSPNEVSELEAMSRALDSEKKLANEIHRIHGEVTRRREAWHDPETGAYLEEHFVHDQAATIRELSGHTNDLKGFLEDADTSSLALHLFDEFLQKS